MSNADEARLRDLLDKQIEAWGGSPQDVSTALSALVDACLEQGKYRRLASLIAERVVAINTEIFGCEHQETARSMNDLAVMYHHQRLLDRAEELYSMVLSVRVRLLGDDHELTAFSLNQLGDVRSEMGLFRQAESDLKRALQIYERLLGCDHPDIAHVLNSLGLNHHRCGQYVDSELCFKRALAVNAKSQAPDMHEAVVITNNLGGLYWEEEKYDAAKEQLFYSLGLSKEIHGPDHPLRASIYINLGAVFMCEDRYADSLRHYEQALSIVNRAFSCESQLAAGILHNIGILHLKKKEYNEAALLLNDAFRSRYSWLLREGVTRPSSTRISFFGSNRLPLPLHCASRSVFLLSFLLFARLNLHGLLQAIEHRQARLVAAYGPHKNLLDDLSDVISELSSPGHDLAQRQPLIEKRDLLENQLYRLLPDLQIQTVEVSDVVSALSLGSALVEFVYHVPVGDRKGDYDPTPCYLAFILRSDGEIDLVELGPAEALESALDMAISATVEGLLDAVASLNDLSRLLIGPLLQKIGDCRTWFVVLDGELHRVPFGALSIPDQEHKLVREAIQVRLLTSGRDLVERSHAPMPCQEPGCSVVVANPDYGSLPDSTDQDTVDPRCQKDSSRDYEHFPEWPPLPGTEIEGRGIAAILGGKLYAGAEATAERVKQVRGPRVLHIAAHGYFLSGKSDIQGRSGVMLDELAELRYSFSEADSLIRSGLVFAGANLVDKYSGSHQGYLTAQEIIHIDLVGTQLVTLSACETCRGDIQEGEGVYGLQRALIVAGARSMLLSLWAVPDEPTCEFMCSFYSLLKEGVSRESALLLTQQSFRQHENITWRHPYFWAAWQLIGDWRPIPDL